MTDSSHEVLTSILGDMGMEPKVAMMTASAIQTALMANGLVIGPQTTGDFGPMAEAATQLHEGFDQLIQKGFSREEAYGLVQILVGTMGRQA
ncbi:hypothetical protein SEA_AZIRA_55 [Gordonia phage Azira]|uniref:Uncharacterized protein n=1 Tax=Gordonia phage Azira TaxID=3035369 RepID=A0AAF0GGS7_9CAUD|nr:hypothetical protein QLQ73_gp55 [Gordonia phage Azira]WGH21061.1 hypothetical protein SEA_AZIRA_55 [Gordonia phage Azira]